MNIDKKFENRQKKMIQDGRGQGRGKEYVPFIQAHDNKVASHGWLTRHLGWKTGRIHHTLSEHERSYLYYLEWLDFVTDIREQYPLEMERTKEIAKQLDIKHAEYKGVPVVMTTDFNITLQSPKGEINVVRTVKPPHKLTKRTLELFEIERRYFSELGIDWCVILSSKLPKVLIKNVEWMCEAKYIETRPSLDHEMIKLISPELLTFIVEDRGNTAISKICLRGDKFFGLENGTCMFILQYELVNKNWETDMSIPIKESKPLLVRNIRGESLYKDKNSG
ncbi:TnsA endonuclease N-terminal domain-containing protein [Gracilibacillus dipsosauri]|uniref:Heteromeric transposase endonuclease subunit TnsA n=1 Tax=Gracilibacillus dipsosauri TaxID=178340 RepID=A0A317L4L3_9BACI|nr:TnsA endonuclease N-terminal domain-containing protein [Gracilibacillus dipsosauri]PWU70443.1 heteromeric transposase endonuclease subunit TnsA [Gracilibacillus dipsosauri]